MGIREKIVESLLNEQECIVCEAIRLEGSIKCLDTKVIKENIDNIEELLNKIKRVL